MATRHRLLAIPLDSVRFASRLKTWANEKLTADVQRAIIALYGPDASAEQFAPSLSQARIVGPLGWSSAIQATLQSTTQVRTLHQQLRLSHSHRAMSRLTRLYPDSPAAALFASQFYQSPFSGTGPWGEMKFLVRAWQRSASLDFRLEVLLRLQVRQQWQATVIAAAVSSSYSATRALQHRLEATTASASLTVGSCLCLDHPERIRFVPAEQWSRVVTQLRSLLRVAATQHRMLRALSRRGGKNKHNKALSDPWMSQLTALQLVAMNQGSDPSLEREAHHSAGHDGTHEGPLVDHTKGPAESEASGAEQALLSWVRYVGLLEQTLHAPQDVQAPSTPLRAAYFLTLAKSPSLGWLVVQADERLVRLVGTSSAAMQGWGHTQLFPSCTAQAQLQRVQGGLEQVWIAATPTLQKVHFPNQTSFAWLSFVSMLQAWDFGPTADGSGVEPGLRIVVLLVPFQRVHSQAHLLSSAGPVQELESRAGSEKPRGVPLGVHQQNIKCASSPAQMPGSLEKTRAVQADRGTALKSGPLASALQLLNQAQQSHWVSKAVGRGQVFCFVVQVVMIMGVLGPFMISGMSSNSGAKMILPHALWDSVAAANFTHGWGQVVASSALTNVSDSSPAWWAQRAAAAPLGWHLDWWGGSLASLDKLTIRYGLLSAGAEQAKTIQAEILAGSAAITTPRYTALDMLRAARQASESGDATRFAAPWQAADLQSLHELNFTARDVQAVLEQGITNTGIIVQIAIVIILSIIGVTVASTLRVGYSVYFGRKLLKVRLLRQVLDSKELHNQLHAGSNLSLQAEKAAMPTFIEWLCRGTGCCVIAAAVALVIASLGLLVVGITLNNANTVSQEVCAASCMYQPVRHSRLPVSSLFTGIPVDCAGHVRSLAAFASSGKRATCSADSPRGSRSTRAFSGSFSNTRCAAAPRRAGVLDVSTICDTSC